MAWAVRERLDQGGRAVDIEEPPEA
jgi:hypothetical protein